MALLFWGLLFNVAAQAQTDDDPPEVSLLTFAPGDVYWERFGHNALLLRLADGSAGVYNYGVFDFRQKNFFLNFARGQMMYRLNGNDFSQTMDVYVFENRWVYEQKLALSVAQRRAMSAYLSDNLLPEHVEYRYDYFADNCSTRVRDAIDHVIGGALRAQLEPRPTAVTYRSEVLRLMAPEPLLMLGMHLGLGPRVDRPLNLWQQAFLPLALMQAMRDVRVPDAAGGTHPLVQTQGFLFQPDTPAEDTEVPPLLLPFAVTGLVIAAALIGLRALRRFASARVLYALLTTTVSLVGGLAGLVLAAGWAFTAHWGMWSNQNLLLLDPLLLLLVPAWIGSARGSWHPPAFASALMSALALVAIASLIVKALPVAHQDNRVWIVLLLPILLAMAWTLRVARRSPPIWSH